MDAKERVHADRERRHRELDGEAGEIREVRSGSENGGSVRCQRGQGGGDAAEEAGVLRCTGSNAAEGRRSRGTDHAHEGRDALDGVGDGDPPRERAAAGQGPS